MSWIHIDDLMELIAFLMKESTVRGVFNATSPFPVTNREFTQALAEAVHRPAIIPVPAFALRLAAGEMADGARQPARNSRRCSARASSSSIRYLHRKPQSHRARDKVYSCSRASFSCVITASTGRSAAAA